MPADPGPIDRYNRKVLYLDREFQEYSLQHEIYLAPIDLDEETRLRDQHEMLKMIYQDWNNSLYPRVVGDPEKILELGFGSGEWAFELAEYDPDCTVLGVDICSLMAVDQLDNMDYQIANLNEPFEFDEPESFDLVHSRFVASGIAATRWPNYVRDIHRMLQPRGWAVLTEWDVVFRSDHSVERLGALQEWTRLYHQSIARSSRPQGRKSMRVAQDCETWMRMAGFVNVTTDIRDVPTCAWRTDGLYRRVGEANLTNMRDLIRSMGLFPLTDRQILTVEEFDSLVAAACEELADVNARPYIRLYTVYGMKP